MNHDIWLFWFIIDDFILFRSLVHLVCSNHFHSRKQSKIFISKLANDAMIQSRDSQDACDWWWYHVTLWWHLKKRFGLLDVWLKLNETVKNLTFKRPLCQSHPNVADSKKLSLNLKLVFVRSCNWFLIKTQNWCELWVSTHFFWISKN